MSKRGKSKDIDPEEEEKELIERVRTFPSNVSGHILDYLNTAGLFSCIVLNTDIDFQRSIFKKAVIPLLQLRAREEFDSMRAYLGIETAKYKEPANPENEGVLIIRCHPGSPSEIAGLEENDVVLRVGGRRITDVSSFIRALRIYRPGERLSFVINRVFKRQFRQIPLEVEIGALGYGAGELHRIVRISNGKITEEDCLVRNPLTGLRYIPGATNEQTYTGISQVEHKLNAIEEKEKKDEETVPVKEKGRRQRDRDGDRRTRTGGGDRKGRGRSGRDKDSNNDKDKDNTKDLVDADGNVLPPGTAATDDRPTTATGVKVGIEHNLWTVVNEDKEINEQMADDLKGGQRKWKQQKVNLLFTSLHALLERDFVESKRAAAREQMEAQDQDMRLSTGGSASLGHHQRGDRESTSHSRPTSSSSSHMLVMQ